MRELMRDARDDIESRCARNVQKNFFERGRIVENPYRAIVHIN